MQWDLAVARLFLLEVSKEISAGSTAFSTGLVLPLLADGVTLAFSPCEALGNRGSLRDARSSVLAACLFGCNPVTRTQSLFGSRALVFPAGTGVDVLAMMDVVEVGESTVVVGSSIHIEIDCLFAVLAFLRC